MKRGLVSSYAVRGAYPSALAQPWPERWKCKEKSSDFCLLAPEIVLGSCLREARMTIIQRDFFLIITGTRKQLFLVLILFYVCYCVIDEGR